MPYYRKYFSEFSSSIPAAVAAFVLKIIGGLDVKLASFHCHFCPDNHRPAFFPTKTTLTSLVPYLVSSWACIVRFPTLTLRLWIDCLSSEQLCVWLILSFCSPLNFIRTQRSSVSRGPSVLYPQTTHDTAIPCHHLCSPQVPSLRFFCYWFD